MDENITEVIASEDIPKDEFRYKMRLTADFGIKDDQAGEKIKDTADKAGVIGSIISVVSGFLVWDRHADLWSFFFGLLIAVAGVMASYVMVSILYSYGDMISLSLEQTKLLKRLEAKKIAELLVSEEREEAKPATESLPELTASEEISAPEPADVLLTEPDDTAETVEELPDFLPEFEADANINANADLPLEAVYSDRLKRIAGFAQRSGTSVICPVCGRKQTSKNDVCYNCECKFIYDAERQGDVEKSA